MNDRLQQWRDREFQRRLLAAIEKPKKNRLLGIINSAFFLWFTSLVLLTLGGSYVTAYQQCTKDAYEEIAQHLKLQREFIERQERIRRIVLQHSTIASMQSELLTPFYFHHEFERHTVRVIVEQYREFSARIKDNQKRSIPAMSLDEIKFSTVEFGDLARLKDEDIPSLQAYVQKRLSYNSIDKLFLPSGLFGSSLEPTCDIWSLYDRFIHGSAATIVQTSSKIFWTKEIRHFPLQR